MAFEADGPHKMKPQHVLILEKIILFTFLFDWFHNLRDWLFNTKYIGYIKKLTTLLLWNNENGKTKLEFLETKWFKQ